MNANQGLEAAARAMGWQPTAGDPALTVDAMLGWLHERGGDSADVEVRSTSKTSIQAWLYTDRRRQFHYGFGCTLLVAFASLVVAVAAAEAKR